MKLALLALASVAALLADQTAFKSGVELVTVPITVTNPGRSIAELGPADFRVFEEGVQQQIAAVQHEELPLSLCLVIDASGSMSGDRSQLAASAFAATASRLSRDDEISVVTFADAAHVALPWTRTPDSAQVSLDVDIGGATALNDGFIAALNLIEHATNRRRAIVVISDGFENSSRTPFTRLMTTRRQSEASVYAFGIASGAPKPGDVALQSPLSQGAGAAWNTSGPGEVDALPLLVGDSGGTVFRVADVPGASRAAINLLDELRHQYTLAYYPTKALDGKYRRIKVEAVRRGVSIRHRRGYLALPSAP